MRTVTLPSGATLELTPAPFAESKALYQALMEEAKGVQISGSLEFASVVKDLLCSGFSSKKMESCLTVCMSRCLYDGPKGKGKIDKDTFEPEDARQDYVSVCMEVTKENVAPFLKSLSVESKHLLAMIGGLLK